MRVVKVSSPIKPNCRPLRNQSSNNSISFKKSAVAVIEQSPLTGKLIRGFSDAWGKVLKAGTLDTVPGLELSWRISEVINDPSATKTVRDTLENAMKSPASKSDIKVAAKAFLDFMDNPV